MSGAAFTRQVSDVNLFAEIEPNQKERIILALKHAGFVVGYMGDGINDASALHAADIGGQAGMTIRVSDARSCAMNTTQFCPIPSPRDLVVHERR